MADRPPVANHNFVVNMTEGDSGARAIGLALVALSYQLDRVIEQLDDPPGEPEPEVEKWRALFDRKDVQVRVLRGYLDDRDEKIERLNRRVKDLEAALALEITGRRPIFALGSPATDMAMRNLLRDLLAMHDAEVFVKEPWDRAFEEARALLGHTKEEHHG